jgi:hypothetical protein
MILACIRIEHISQNKSFLSVSRWRLMSKMAVEIQSSITSVFPNIFAFCFLQCICIFVSYTNQEHILSKGSKMPVRSKMADQNQFFRHKSESIQHFFIFFAFICITNTVRRKFCGKKVFQKIQDGGKYYFFIQAEIRF